MIRRGRERGLKRLLERWRFTSVRSKLSPKIFECSAHLWFYLLFYFFWIHTYDVTSVKVVACSHGSTHLPPVGALDSNTCRRCSISFELKFCKVKAYILETPFTHSRHFPAVYLESLGRRRRYLREKLPKRRDKTAYATDNEPKLMMMNITSQTQLLLIYYLTM